MVVTYECYIPVLEPGHMTTNLRQDHRVAARGETVTKIGVLYIHCFGNEVEQRLSHMGAR